VIQRLADMVSKNGVLLLSIPQRGDGSIDAEEAAILGDMASWMAVNGEAIHGTRPWRVWGEGPTEIREGMHGEGAVGPFTAADVRFTAKGETLYAIAMDWPEDGQPLRITSLGRRATSGRTVQAVELLGASAVAFEQTDNALTVRLPGTRPVAFAPALRVRGLT
ncbi:MAG: alpha-L-fucosidase, partial [Brevundimonas sp.]